MAYFLSGILYAENILMDMVKDIIKSLSTFLSYCFVFTLFCLTNGLINLNIFYDTDPQEALCVVFQS